ncbi:MAG: L-rhamnose mutarotase [Sphingobacteriaceae bacterium]
MEKIAFKMKLKPGCKEEYKRRHAALWPELHALLKASQISDYSIFLDEQTDMLFAVQVNRGSNSQEMGETEIVKKWWAYMADMMDTNPDNSPVSTTLEMMFHME